MNHGALGKRATSEVLYRGSKQEQVSQCFLSSWIQNAQMKYEKKGSGAKFRGENSKMWPALREKKNREIKGSSVEKEAWNGERNEDRTLRFHKSCFAATRSRSVLGSLTPASATLSRNLLSNERYKRLRFFTTSCKSPWGKAGELGQQTALTCTK